MKIVSQQELDEYQKVVRRGGIEGFVMGLGVSLPVSYLLHKQWPYYRRLPPALKSLGIVAVAIPWCVIRAEHKGFEHERQQWVLHKAAGLEELNMAKQRDEAVWNRMDSSQKAIHWANQHRYGIIGGAWAASMGVSSAIIFRNPYQTFAQKLVQARIWAQGLTVAVLLASAGVASLDRQGSSKDHHEVEDHSWKLAIEGKH